MKAYVALGSNSEQARANLEFGAKKLLAHPQALEIRFSSLYRTPALLPKGAPSGWNKTFLNAVCEITWDGNDPYELLEILKQTETACEPRSQERWAPRGLDLDLLLFGDLSLQSERLKLPHPELKNRAFVLDPLGELSPSLCLPGEQTTVLQLRRKHHEHSPALMGILNLTPDSFSDGGLMLSDEQLSAQIQNYLTESVQYFDLGAESTRPGAEKLSIEEEWERLSPVLIKLGELKKDQVFFPKISVDTYKPEIAARAIELGADMINDVGAGRSDEMLKVLSQSHSDYICMHSLSVPADKTIHLDPKSDPVQVVYEWGKALIQRASEFNISPDRIIIDPGIGFGKTAEQSLMLLQNLTALLDLPVRVLVGHSRKSFMNIFSHHPNSERNYESIGISMGLARSGVEILRVHDAHLHQRALIACQHLNHQYEN